MTLASLARLFHLAAIWPDKSRGPVLGPAVRVVGDGGVGVNGVTGKGQGYRI